ncbi:unnamed protein product [Effrenium voratum]|nr:unnamed protein product [Effrenium voratum]
MLGQLAIHLACMVYIAELAKVAMGEDEVKAVIEFEKERNKQLDALTEEEMSEWNWFSSVPFKSNLLNTCCWLVETAQQALGGRGVVAEQLEGYCTTSRRDLADVRIGSAFL